MWSYRSGYSNRSVLRSSSSTEGNQGLSRQLALTTIAPAGFLARKKSSIESDLRRGFQLAHSSDPSARMVGRNRERLRALKFCASSTRAILKPSSDLIDSAV